MPKRWVISDIHGCSKTFKALLAQLKLTKDDELYLLGDYINKGPGSKAVIKRILKLKAEGYKVRCLKGNHEDVMLRSLNDPILKPFFRQQGGQKTLKSFGVSSMANIPDEYMEFFKTLEYYIELDDYVLVHAGFNFIKKDVFKDKHAMMWSRHDKVLPERINYRKIVHGHTPTSLKKIKDNLKAKKSYEIVVDNGCVYHVVGQGNLVALELNTLKLVVQPNIEFAILDKTEKTKKL